MVSNIPIVLAALLALSACSKETGSPADSLPDPVFATPTYVAQPLTTDSSFEFTLTASNPKPHAIRFYIWSPCTLSLRVYSSPDLNATPVWDPSFRLPCKRDVVTVDLDPGESKVFKDYVLFEPFLQGGYSRDKRALPAGGYFFQATFTEATPEPRVILFPAVEVDVH